MTAVTTLQDYLESWVSTDTGDPAGDLKKPVAKVLSALAAVSKEISTLIARGALAGNVAAVVGEGSGGDTQKVLDQLTNDMVVEALKLAPVAFIASEELEDAIATEKTNAPLCVAVDPLDGSSNIDTNVSIGTIFSILPRRTEAFGNIDTQFFQTGRNQLAAGYFVYGPHTALVLTVGEGTHTFTLDLVDGNFKLTSANIRVPSETKEFAINGSNFRHWDDQIRNYINDCLDGSAGPRNKNFNTRWIGSMVAECHRILVRGGVYLYPGDVRDGYGDGRLRLLYEGSPIAFLMEQAGGVATTGWENILELEPTSVHQRVPLIFGSSNEVDEVRRYLEIADKRSPLFGQRGLFRT